jgi:hypothetical protein
MGGVFNRLAVCTWLNIAVRCTHASQCLSGMAQCLVGYSSPIVAGEAIDDCAAGSSRSLPSMRVRRLPAGPD